MKNLKELQEQRDELLAKANAIVALAREENREFTEDEAKEYDSITDEKSGSIAAVDRDIARAKRLESLMAKQAIQQAVDDRKDADPKRIVVPATAKTTGSLKSFKRIEDAYTVGQWCLASLFGRDNARQWCSDHGIEVRNALSGSGAANVLVPDVMENSIIELMEQYGVARQYCDVYPMSSDNVTVPRRTSGVTVYFVGDNTEITASDPAWDAVTLSARKLAALTKYSSEIAEDAVVSIADRLTNEIAYALAVKEDACLFLGTGTSTYGGITGLISAIAAGSKVTATAGNTAFSTLDLADFEAMIGKLPLYPGIMPAWFISQAGWAASMMRLADAAGGNTVSNIMGGVGKSFLGFPVVITQTMNSTLTAQTSTDGLCYFGDLRMGVLFGNRRGITLSSTMDRYFEYDQLAIKGTERFDINVHGAGGASTAGPIIMLSTPSA